MRAKARFGGAAPEEFLLAYAAMPEEFYLSFGVSGHDL